MALPGSGPLSLGDINVELGRSRTSTISLDAAENGSYGAINQNSTSRPSSSNPARVSEWYGYNHSAASCPPYGTYLSQYCSGCTLYYRYANGSCGYYDIEQGCTTACGGCCCSPAYGTQLNWYCSGGTSIGQYSDGCNGTYDAQINPCDPSCGCSGGCVGKGCFS